MTFTLPRAVKFDHDHTLPRTQYQLPFVYRHHYGRSDHCRENMIPHVRRVMGVTIVKFGNHLSESIHHVLIRSRVEIGGGQGAGGVSNVYDTYSVLETILDCLPHFFGNINNLIAFLLLMVKRVIFFSFIYQLLRFRSKPVFHALPGFCLLGHKKGVGCIKSWLFLIGIDANRVRFRSDPGAVSSDEYLCKFSSKKTDQSRVVDPYQQNHK